MPLYQLNINQKNYSIEAAADMPLLWVLRDLLQLKGTKFGCGKALCGACTVHLNGNAVRSCSLPVSAAANSNIQIVTVEGLAQNNVLTAVQEAWIEEDVPQCGYCQAGQIMTASALLAKNANPTDQEIEAAMVGNLCRCGTYPRIQKAIKNAIQKMQKGGKK
ncbi:MAG: (2Fe-2S)-binding protein [Cytophagales bacterium]|nr:MAG: (2Fe-2S)-binding protein [Cytophagales bacterium]